MNQNNLALVPQTSRVCSTCKRRITLAARGILGGFAGQFCATDFIAMFGGQTHPFINMVAQVEAEEDIVIARSLEGQ